MTPRKTELALTALQSHRSPLTLLQRRALILADGQRDLATLSTLLGGDAAELVQSLCTMGYLQSDTAGTGALTGPPATAQHAPALTRAPDALPTEDDLQRQRRRATTNARLYLLDILQLQRNPAAAVLYRHLHAARTEAHIGVAIAEALRELPQITSASYAERVRAHVGELLPDGLQLA
ncbi:hypothetical protein [Xanthomonas sp. 3075]|uniref:hypothetical protein n=1 Tax=Xanthomonas sp. 3075 TaxID=3035315 RepID=UPI001618FAA5|nr:hypothetical protein [Xanthomonas sp. 3075]MBB4131376.1 hypothetical protein [Xanthomonas sp. 3075]